METELRWLKAVERERLLKNTYPWVLGPSTPSPSPYSIPKRPPYSPQESNFHSTLSDSYTKSYSAVLDKTVATETTQKFDVPTQTHTDLDQKSPTFRSLKSMFHNSSHLLDSSGMDHSSWQNSPDSPASDNQKPSHKFSERSPLKQSALSVHSIFDSGLISKSSLREKSEVMQAVYSLLDSLERSDSSVESVLSKYSGRARKVCEVVLEYINKEVSSEYQDPGPLGKVVELSRIQEVTSESSLESKGITAMLGDVLKEIIQVKQDVKLLSNSSNS